MLWTKIIKRTHEPTNLMRKIADWERQVEALQVAFCKVRSAAARVINDSTVAASSLYRFHGAMAYLREAEGSIGQKAEFEFPNQGATAITSFLEFEGTQLGKFTHASSMQSVSFEIALRTVIDFAQSYITAFDDLMKARAGLARKVTTARRSLSVYESEAVRRHGEGPKGSGFSITSQLRTNDDLSELVQNTQKEVQVATPSMLAMQ
mmetsp:Transcript_1093/g.4653  ORF Transcript_1093/g.4653 Transcript_1093/m.4653 type:complete len:207 (-) Transcript_1093:621-1241(-)